MKELIKEVKRLNKRIELHKKTKLCTTEQLVIKGIDCGKLEGIKQTVEAVDNHMLHTLSSGSLKDWQKLKKLLEIK